MDMQHLTVDFFCSTTPTDVFQQYPNLKSLKVKGVGNNGLFQPLPDRWGGYATPWVSQLGKLSKLDSIYFKYMIVTDHDLQLLAELKKTSLESMKLVGCSGFSTKGLDIIVLACRNLQTFSIRGSEIDTEGAQSSDSWFQHLAATNAGCLKTVDLDAKWSSKDYASLNIQYKDVKSLVRRCKVEALVLQDIEPIKMVRLVEEAKHLREFQGGTEGDIQHPVTTFNLPPLLKVVGLYNLNYQDMYLYHSILGQLKSLDVTRSNELPGEIVDFVKDCPNLEELKAKGIGDEGLITLSQHCKKLVTLVLVPVHSNEHNPSPPITEEGLIALSSGCTLLEKLSIFVDVITNKALKSIGELVHLRYFRLVLLYRCPSTPRFVALNDGVKSLLMGCTNLTKLDLHLGRGGLSNDGLSYNGKYGNQLTKVLLGYVGGSDEGLLAFAKGCPKLQKLAMRGEKGQYSLDALFEVGKKTSLNFIWLQGFFDALTNDQFALAKEQWNLDKSLHVEIFPVKKPLDTVDETNWYKDLYGEVNDSSKLKLSHHLIAYRSMSTEATPVAYPVQPHSQQLKPDLES